MQTIERAALLGLGLLALAFGAYRVACIARGLRGFRDAERGRTAQRLRLMKDVQARNEEREQKWRERHASEV